MPKVKSQNVRNENVENDSTIDHEGVNSWNKNSDFMSKKSKSQFELVEQLLARNATFQEDLSSADRKTHGTHYSPINLMQKLIEPTIILPLKREWQAVKEGWQRKRSIQSDMFDMPFWQRFEEYKVLDPACGCGNILIVAFYELRKLEEEIKAEARSLGCFVPRHCLITAKNFHGIEKNAEATLRCKSNLSICEMNFCHD